MFERFFGLLMLRPEDVLATLAGILATGCGLRTPLTRLTITIITLNRTPQEA
jgi:hypothetical protein